MGFNPYLDWLSYYYSWRNHWSCSQEIVLAHLAKYLFGFHSNYYRQALVKILAKATVYSLSRHSFYKRYNNFAVPSVDCRLMIAGSIEDKIVPWSEIEKWRWKLKPDDILWQCPRGEHFFHYFQPQLIGEKLLEFWSQEESLMVS